MSSQHAAESSHVGNFQDGSVECGREYRSPAYRIHAMHVMQNPRFT